MIQAGHGPHLFRRPSHASRIEPFGRHEPRIRWRPTRRAGGAHHAALPALLRNHGPEPGANTKYTAARFKKSANRISGQLHGPKGTVQNPPGSMAPPSGCRQRAARIGQYARRGIPPDSFGKCSSAPQRSAGHPSSVAALWRLWRKKRWSEEGDDRRKYLAVRLVLLVDVVVVGCGPDRGDPASPPQASGTHRACGPPPAAATDRHRRIGCRR